MSPHTPIYVYMCPHTTAIEPLSIPQQTAMYVSSRPYISSVLTLYACMCPHATGAGGAHVFVEPVSIPQQHRREEQEQDGWCPPSSPPHIPHLVV